MQLNRREIALITKHLTDKLAAYLIIVFGSAARGRLRPDSDIDLAFLSKYEFSQYDVFMAAQELAGILDRDVDLVDLSKASTVFQAQIVGKGKVLFCSDDKERMVFAMTALKKYAKLNEERACILAKVTERGRVYAE
ncbi:MAG: nucleotidyltransferase domain-containing protein [Syntrophomonadaceae bacterium]|nr:nucleotidyltransferase domain-containing protein [Syntrophomonadaceae bacterium]